MVETLGKIGFSQFNSTSSKKDESKPKTKKCKKCGRVLEVKNFQKHAHTEDGLQPWCKECVAEYNHLYQEHKDEGGVQKCRKCKEIKPLSEFGKSEAYKNGHLKVCKVCAAKMTKGDSMAEETPQERPQEEAALTTCTDRQLFDEIKKRGYTGTLTKVETLKIEV